MKATKLSLAVAGVVSLVAASAHAAGPTLSDVLGNSGISASGYVDASYSYLDAKNPGNAFDGNNGNTFNLKQAAIQLAKQPASGFGGLVNITTGSDADIIKSGPYTSGTGSSAGFDVTQAFAQYTDGQLTLQAGKFATLASAEVIAPTGNTNITRSLEFFNVPYTHTGVRLTLAPSSTVTVYAGINNGWDLQQDNNHSKTGELGVAYSPSSTLSWALQAYSGPEGIAATKQNRTLIDTVVTVKPTTSLSFILNADYGKQDKASAISTGADATWNIVALYANIQATDQLRYSLRYENVDAKDGYLPTSYSTAAPGVISKKDQELTLTVGYAPSSNIELRGELRSDKADKAVFAKTKSAGLTDKSNTVALEALYKF